LERTESYVETVNPSQEARLKDVKPAELLPKGILNGMAVGPKEIKVSLTAEGGSQH
jgi:hypothetical protein